MSDVQTATIIYRAKKIESDEYIEGSYVKDCEDNHFITNGRYKHRASSGLSLLLTEIDLSTLAIHFPDMLASDSDRVLPNRKKDLRIFASLSEDGKGGDVILTKDGRAIYKRIYMFCKDGLVCSKDIETVQKLSKKFNSVKDLKIIGKSA
jgi:hypothetical protein